VIKRLWARIPVRTRLVGAAMLLVVGYGIWAFQARGRGQTVWESAAAFMQPVPAHENAIVGGLRQNREAAIQHAQAIEQLKAHAEQSRVTIERLQTELQQAQAQLALKPSAPPLGLSEAETRKLIAEQMAYVMAARAAPAPEAPPPPKTQLLQGLDKPGAALVPAPEPEPEAARQWIRIPDRATAKAVTLSGSAAQANGEPQPLNLEIEADIEGPNGVRIPLAGCRVAATMVVETIPARAQAQVSGLSCALTLPDGSIRPVEVPLKGWLTGADNVNGSFADIFHNEAAIYKRFGQAAVPVALVSLLEETRQVVHQVSPLTGVVTTVGNDVAQEIAREIATFYIEKAREYFDPVAWVGDNQRVYVHVDGGATLPIEAHELEAKHLDTRPVFSRYR
jgi:hypothetical protein